MAKKKGISDIEYDIEFYKSLSGEQALKERLNGRLPIIDIAGHPFFVDVRIGRLRPKDNFMTLGLDLENGGYYDDNKNRYCFLYHIPSMEEAKVSRDIIALPKDVVEIQFPHKYALDPIAMARENGVDPTFYLKRYPLVMYRVAKVIPANKTYMATVVHYNLKQLEEKLAKKQITPKKVVKKNKHRGLGH
jgi:hypothetical protein